MKSLAFSLMDKGGEWALVLFIVALGIAIAYLPLTLSVALVLGSLIVLGILVRPILGLYLLAFAVPFGSWREIRVGAIGLGGTEVLAALILLAWGARMIASRKIIFLPAPLALPLLIFLGAISLSLPGALSLQYSLKGLLVWLGMLGIYLATVNLVRKQEETRWLIVAILLAGSAEALLGIYQFLSGKGPTSFLLSGRFTRAFGTFEQPNPFGGYMGLVLPLALGLAFAPQGEPFEGPRRWWMRGIALGASATIGSALIMSWSRGAWLGAISALGAMAVIGLLSKAFEPRILGIVFGIVAGALTILWFGRDGVVFGLGFGALVALAVGVLASADLKNRWLFVLLALVLVFGGIFVMLRGERLVPSALAERLLDFLPYLRMGDVRAIVVTEENYAVVERLAHWQAAWEMFEEHPLTGVGIGNYEPVYPAYALPGWNDPLGHAHNYYLHIAAETGLIGLLGYLVLWGAALWHGLRVHLLSQVGWRGITLGLIGVIAALSVHNFFDNLYVHGMNLHLAILLGVITVIGEQDGRSG